MRACLEVVWCHGVAWPMGWHGPTGWHGPQGSMAPWAGMSHGVAWPTGWHSPMRLGSVQEPRGMQRDGECWIREEVVGTEGCA